MDETRRADPRWSVEHYGFGPQLLAPSPALIRGRHRRTTRTLWPRVARGGRGGR